MILYDKIIYALAPKKKVKPVPEPNTLTYAEKLNNNYISAVARYTEGNVPVQRGRFRNTKRTEFRNPDFKQYMIVE